MSYKDLLEVLRDIYSITENDDLSHEEQIKGIQLNIEAIFDQLGEAI